MIEIKPITDRDTWLEWRREALTASDIGAIAGVDPYRSALQVYAEKVNYVPLADTPLMRRGRLMEAAAVEYIRDEHPDWIVTRPNAFYVDRGLKLGCTPDAIVRTGDGRILNCQIKTVSRPVFDRWDGKAPAGYQLQVACENAILEPDGGMLAVLVVSAFDAELHLFEVPRHPVAEQKIIAMAADFWANIAAGLYPAPDYERDAEIIAHLRPPRADVPVPLDLSQDNRIYALLEDRDRLKADISNAEAVVKAFDAEIRDKLNGATSAIAEGWKISNTMIERPEHVTKASKYQRLLVTRLAEKEEAA